MPRMSSGITVSKNFNRILLAWAHEDNVAYALCTGHTPMMRHVMVELPIFGDYFDLNGELISFTPDGKQAYPRETGGWDEAGRQSMKPGRFARSLFLPESFSDVEYEGFANRIKALHVEQQGVFYTNTGEDIRALYYEGCAAKGSGSLDKSCMRYRENQPYFDLYAQNPDKIELLTLVNKQSRVIGRALIWTTEEVGRVMDRIYGTDATVSAFRQRAVEQGLPYRTFNSTERPSRFTFPQGARDLRLSVPLANWRHKSYPYCDTFKFLHEDGVASNHQRDHVYYYVLNSTHGGPRLRVPCVRCKNLVSPDEWIEGGMCHTCWSATHCKTCNTPITPGATTREGYCNACVTAHTCHRCHAFSERALYGGEYCHACAYDLACYDCGRYFADMATKESKASQVCPACAQKRAERERRTNPGLGDLRNGTYTVTTSSSGTSTWTFGANPLPKLSEQLQMLRGVAQPVRRAVLDEFAAVVDWGTQLNAAGIGPVAVDDDDDDDIVLQFDFDEEDDDA